MNIEEQKRKLEKEADIYNHELTDIEFYEILKRIEYVPIEKRTKGKWQTIIQEVANCQFWLNEGLDLSDINSVHQEILSMLNRNGNS